ncbi:hypothetical protein [Desulfotomaculum copahuensis]|uniref:hypothetical protein n=1 Tax=Desulfotomaculum copahuensis TaxID=1838280 RepID=UPI000AAAC0FC|nr:hypothetical protein [Desulfotomaculum copahuensis]
MGIVTTIVISEDEDKYSCQVIPADMDKDELVEILCQMVDGIIAMTKKPKLVLVK